MINFLKNTIFIFVLFVIFQTGAIAQTAYTRQTLWEKEIAAFAAADKKAFPESNKTLFVGSSSIRGWRTLKEDFPDYYIVNRGFGGSHIEDVIFYAAGIVFPYKPKLIVFYAGENDIAAGKSVDAVFNDFKTFAASVKRKLPKTRLIVVSLKPSPARQEFAAKYKELNALIKTETERDKNFLFVDVWTPMTNRDGEPKPEIFLADKLHMNREGYKIWRETLAPFIKTGLKKSFR